jgi:hypothetical protein
MPAFFMAKGFNIRQSKEGDFELNIHVEQFSAWISSLPKTTKGWVSLNVHKLKEEDPRGYTHNMMQIFREKSNGV